MRDITQRILYAVITLYLVGNSTTVSADLETRLTRLENQLKINITNLREKLTVLEQNNQELKIKSEQGELLINSESSQVLKYY